MEVHSHLDSQTFLSLSLQEKLKYAQSEATKLSRRLAQHTDLRIENMWGEFCASIEWTRNKLNTLSIEQKNEKDKYIMTLLDEFYQILHEPGAKETPACIMAGIFLSEFVEIIQLG